MSEEHRGSTIDQIHRITSEQIILSRCFDSGLVGGLVETMPSINHNFLPFLVDFSVSQNDIISKKTLDIISSTIFYFGDTRVQAEIVLFLLRLL